MTSVAPSKEILLQLAQQLPASPQILLQLGELLTDVNSGLEDVANLLRRDTGLAARVIRISNSVAFGAGGRVAAVEDAVNRVGYAEIYRLVGLATATQMTEQNLTSYGITGIQLRDNTLVTALAAEAIAARTDIDSRVVYTAGLLRSTGKMVLDRYAKRLPRVTAYPGSGASDLLDWESSTFECTNISAAETVLAAWRFPAVIVSPIRGHFSPPTDTSISNSLTFALHVASAIAANLGAGLPGEHSFWQSSSSVARLIGLTPSLVNECTEQAKQAFEGIKGSL